MMKKRVLIVLLSILCLFGLYLGISYVKADSGWDYDYDSGSSWDSGSDWGGSRDRDYSYSRSYDRDTGSYHHSSSGGYSGDKAYVAYIVIFYLIVICIIDAIVSSRKRKDPSYYSTTGDNHTYEFKDISDDILNKYGIKADVFKEMVYKKYVDIQNAWSNFEYDKLKDLLTDELYNTYVMQLDALKLHKQKNIMSDFECIDCKITNVMEENGIINVVTFLRIHMFDYVVDKDNNIVRGTDKNKVDIQYIIKFVKAKDDSKERICPNCGAKINAVVGGQCEYCKTIVLVDPNEFVMSSKTNIGQRRI